jgi:superfamily II DNA or RNA helicase
MANFDKKKSVYPETNNTNFPQTLKHNLGLLEYDDKKQFLKYHQYITSQYISQNPDIRGLLIYFNVGFGKTILAISLARLYKKIDPSRKIVVLLSKGLIQNFKDNVKKFLLQYPEFNNFNDIDMIKEIDTNFQFISFRSNLMYKKISKIQKSQDQIDFDSQIGDVNKMIIEKGDFMENTVLIIDEAHNFFNAITNGSSNSLQLYDTIMKTRNIKLFFLTGTPIVNDPFELVPCFNMIKGYIPVKSKFQKSQSVTLLPESRKEFYNYFVNKKDLEVKNKQRFQNRIMGMSSYYGDLYFDEKSKDFPEQLPTIIEKVSMSPEQFLAYDAALDDEKDEASFKNNKQSSSERFSTKSSSSGTYRIRTRQISNFIFPEYAMGPSRGKKMREKFINKVTKEDWNDLEKYSPKILKVLDNLKKHNGQPGFIYTEFVTGEGIAVLEKVLELNGYMNWDEAQSKKSLSYAIDKETKITKKIFAIITGKLDLVQRTEVIAEFNKTDNSHGERIALLLVNKIASEGLDLKAVRHIHILEPFWNYARIEQVIGRGVRYKSHEMLPVKERVVQPYIYLSDYPSTYPLEKIKEPTTDIDMYQKVMAGKTLNDRFNMSVVESSMDCLVHYSSLSENLKKKINCKLCSPTNKPMYHPIISKDFSVPDPCMPITEHKIQAKEIIDEATGEKFAYTTDSKNTPPKISIYQYKDAINGYVGLKINHPSYETLVNKILDTL